MVGRLEVLKWLVGDCRGRSGDSGEGEAMGRYRHYPGSWYGHSPELREELEARGLPYRGQKHRGWWCLHCEEYSTDGQWEKGDCCAHCGAGGWDKWAFKPSCLWDEVPRSLLDRESVSESGTSTVKEYFTVRRGKSADK